MKRRWMLVCLTMPLCATMLGCGASMDMSPRSGQASDAAVARARPPAEGGQGDGGEPGMAEQRKLVYEGWFTLRVPDIPDAQRSAQRLAEKHGGYLERLEGSQVILRVPAKRFHTVVDALGELGTVTDRRIRVHDETESHADLETRLNNARAMAERLRGMLKRTTDMEKALKIEQELRRVMTEIEQLEGKLRRSESQIAFATVTLSFQRRRPVEPVPLSGDLPIRWLGDLGLGSLLSFRGVEIH